MSWRLRTLCALGLNLGWAFLFVPFAAGARLNLPQSKQVVILREDAAGAAHAYFVPSVVRSELSPSLAQLLVNSLPADFRRACADIVGSWGSEAAGTEAWRTRLLSNVSNQVWLAFRCASPRPDLSQYFDERLAVLRLGPARLEFLPLGQDLENDSTLYHLEFAELLTLQGGEAHAFRVASSNDNPCCGGPESTSEERLVVFIDTPQGVSEALSVVTRRNDYSHSDDEEGDSEAVYKAEVNFERDSQGGVNGATAAFHEEVRQITWQAGVSQPQLKSQRSGTLRYRWDPASFHFEEVK